MIDNIPKVRGKQEVCYYCGTKEECTKDHFYPKSKGGTTVVWACRICQFTKQNEHPLNWLDYINNHIAFTEEFKRKVNKSILHLHNQISKRNEKRLNKHRLRFEFRNEGTE